MKLVAGQELSCINTSTMTSFAVGMPGEEIQDRPGENVVAIPGDHVSCAAHIGELDLREAREKIVSALLADEVAHLAPNEKHGHSVAQDRVDGCIHPIGVGDLEWGKRRGLVHVRHDV